MKIRESFIRTAPFCSDMFVGSGDSFGHKADVPGAPSGYKADVPVDPFGYKADVQRDIFAGIPELFGLNCQTFCFLYVGIDRNALVDFAEKSP